VQKEEERMTMAHYVSGKIALQGEKEDLMKVFGTFIKTLECNVDELTDVYSFNETENEVEIHVPKNAILLIDDNHGGICVTDLILKKVEGIWALTGCISGQYCTALQYFADMAYEFNLKGTAYSGNLDGDWKTVIEVENKKVKKFGEYTLSTGEYRNYLSGKIESDSLILEGTEQQ
jgi:hypothetical protein